MWQFSIDTSNGHQHAYMHAHLHRTYPHAPHIHRHTPGPGAHLPRPSTHTRAHGPRTHILCAWRSSSGANVRVERSLPCCCCTCTSRGYKVRHAYPQKSAACLLARVYIQPVPGRSCMSRWLLRMQCMRSSSKLRRQWLLRSWWYLSQFCVLNLKLSRIVNFQNLHGHSLELLDNNLKKISKPFDVLF